MSSMPMELSSTTSFSPTHRTPVGHLYKCPAPAYFVDPACSPFTDAFIVDSLGFSLGFLWISFLALVAFVLVFIAGSAVLLYFLSLI